jgi:hypothetical protein
MAILQLERQVTAGAVKDKVTEELQDFGDTLGRKTLRTDDA